MNPPVWVTAKELQDKFNRNEGGYPAKIHFLRRELIYNRPASAKSRQKHGTMSRLYKYFDGNKPAMWLHCFVEPSGDLGASKKMDPKRLLIGGTYYYCD
jgi:hypothetical protein